MQEIPSCSTRASARRLVDARVMPSSTWWGMMSAAPSHRATHEGAGEAPEGNLFGAKTSSRRIVMREYSWSSANSASSASHGFDGRLHSSSCFPKFAAWLIISTIVRPLVRCTGQARNFLTIKVARASYLRQIFKCRAGFLNRRTKRIGRV
jgi:hypothetical protein